jgi:hypothetical protein
VGGWGGRKEGRERKEGKEKKGKKGPGYGSGCLAQLYISRLVSSYRDMAAAAGQRSVGFG